MNNPCEACPLWVCEAHLAEGISHGPRGFHGGSQRLSSIGVESGREVQSEGWGGVLIEQLDGLCEESGRGACEATAEECVDEKRRLRGGREPIPDPYDRHLKRLEEPTVEPRITIRVGLGIGEIPDLNGDLRIGKMACSGVAIPSIVARSAKDTDSWLGGRLKLKQFSDEECGANGGMLHQ